ncbi:hypothetical protein Hanom_Chr08g00690741 [Helianthus anomalus]
MNMNIRFVCLFMFMNVRLCSFIYICLCSFQFKYISSYIYMNIEHKSNFLTTYINITNC